LTSLPGVVEFYPFISERNGNFFSRSSVNADFPVNIAWARCPCKAKWALSQGNMGCCRGNTTVMLKFTVSRYERLHGAARGYESGFQPRGAAICALPIVNISTDKEPVHDGAVR
jgi:hypothetical protein